MQKETNEPNFVTSDGIISNLVAFVVVPYLFLVNIFWFFLSIAMFFSATSFDDSDEKTTNVVKHISFWMAVLILGVFIYLALNQ